MPVPYHQGSGAFFLYLNADPFPLHMSTKIFIFSTWAVMLLGAESLAQNMLILQRGSNQKTRITYEVGESITYLQREIGYYITDNIREITSEYIELSENVLSIHQLEAIDIRLKDERNRTLKNLTLLPAAGAGLLLTAETINGLYADGRFSYNNVSLGIAGGLVGASLIMSQVRYKKFRLRGRNKIQVITREEWEDTQ